MLDLSAFPLFDPQASVPDNSEPLATPGGAALVVLDAASDLAPLRDHIEGRYEVVVLKGARAPLEAIADAVAGRAGLRALHLFTHGAPGALLSADGPIDLATLQGAPIALARIGAAVAGGDIFIYGCRVGAGDAGAAFLSHLAEATGATVSAATGFVGAAARGGHWTLDAVHGQPRAHTLAFPAFDGLLASGILQNRYVRFGYSDDGTLGYGGTTPPGIQYDPDGTRNFLNTADSLTPGVPFEGFTIAIGGAQYSEGNSVSDGAATNGTHIVSTDFNNEGADTWGSITYVTEVGGLRVTQTLTLDGVDAKAIKVSVSVENVSGAAISDVTYARYLDPDVDSNGLPGSTSRTINVRGTADIAPEDVILSTGPVSGRVIGYYSDSSVTHNTSVSPGWSDAPAAYLAGTDWPGSGDHVIGIGFDVGDIAAGESRAFTFDVIFAPSVEDVNESIPNAATVLGGSSSPVAALEQEAILVAPALTVSDADNATLSSATVSITGGFVAGEDILAFTTVSGMGNISGTYDGATGILTLASAGATATLAEWQAALRAVTYAATSDAPDTSARTISFIVNDGLRDSAAWTATVNVTSVNDAPTGTPTGSLPDGVAGTPYLIRAADLLAGFSDTDGDPLSIGDLSASSGTLVANGDGTWTLTTPAAFSGSVTLSFAVRDAGGGTLAAQTRDLTLAAGSVSPTAIPEPFTLQQNAPGIALDVLANDTGGDPEGRRITHINDTAIAVGQMVAVAGGTVLLSVGGSIIFRPSPDFVGDVVFTYRFSDETGAANTGTVTGHVAGPENLPRASNDLFVLSAEGAPVVIDVTANDSHPNGTDLTITHVDGRALAPGNSLAVRGGDVMLTHQNSLVFTPLAGLSGAISFTYTAIDGEGRAAEALVTSSSSLHALAPAAEAALAAAGLPRVLALDDLMAIASVVAPGGFGMHGLSSGTGYQQGAGYALDLDSATVDTTLVMQALLAIVAVQTAGTGSAMLAAHSSGAMTSAIDQNLLFQSVLSSDSDVHLDIGTGAADFASPGSSLGAWSRAFAQHMLSAQVSPDFVRQTDGHSQALSHQADVTAGSLLSVGIDGASAGTPQAALSNLFGLVDFVSADAQSAVQVARTVMVAQTANGSDGQTAKITLRQNGMNEVDVAFYRVDDYSGTVDGLRPGDSGYDSASAARAYETSEGSSWIKGGGYGALSTAELVGINSGDLIVMRLRSDGDDFYAFSRANEVVNGEHVNHLWNYGLNTWGWEDLYGGGDQDFNDLVIRLDFVPTADAMLS
ncbi:MAG: cadherin-like domain-containing protein [Pseudomonadota bacterium]